MDREQAVQAAKRCRALADEVEDLGVRERLHQLIDELESIIASLDWLDPLAVSRRLQATTGPSIN